MTPKAPFTVALAGLLALAGCGSDSQPGDPAPSPAAPETGAPTASPEVDPYEVYLQLAPPDAPDLTREQAFVRAFYGCGKEHPPGTVDRALADAYRPTGICESADSGLPTLGPCNQLAGKPTAEVVESGLCDLLSTTVMLSSTSRKCPDGRTVWWNDYGWGYEDDIWQVHRRGDGQRLPPDDVLNTCTG